MIVKELKEVLDNVPDDYHVLVDVFKNEICQEFDNNHILSEITELSVYNDIKTGEYLHIDKDESKLIKSYVKLGGRFILSNKYND